MNYFDEIFVISLPERQDRRDLILNQFYDYGISCCLYDATKHMKGYYGLLLTMKALFKECLKHGYDKILVFEDDAKIIESVEVFHQTMDACVEQLGERQWDLFYLGLQPTREFGHFVSMNLLPVVSGQSTHAVAYSKHAMEFFLKCEFDEPIDNWIVRVMQPYNTSFCSYPLLCTQYDGYSNIYNERLSWDKFITPLFKKNICHALQTRNF